VKHTDTQAPVFIPGKALQTIVLDRYGFRLRFHEARVGVVDFLFPEIIYDLGKLVLQTTAPFTSVMELDFIP
jgi:hypothetical protein